MDKVLGDKIPDFNKKQEAGGNVGIAGASLGLGGHRTKLEVLVIVLVAVAIIGGSELLLATFKVPQYVLPTCRLSSPRLTTTTTSMETT